MTRWRPQLGARVRVKAGVGCELSCPELRHYPEEHGRAGRIIGDRARLGAPAHRFVVSFDRPGPVVRMGPIGPVPFPVRHYAADELELAED